MGPMAKLILVVIARINNEIIRYLNMLNDFPILYH